MSFKNIMFLMFVVNVRYKICCAEENDTDKQIRNAVRPRWHFYYRLEITEMGTVRLHIITACGKGRIFWGKIMGKQKLQLKSLPPIVYINNGSSQDFLTHLNLINGKISITWIIDFSVLLNHRILWSFANNVFQSFVTRQSVNSTQ